MKKLIHPKLQTLQVVKISDVLWGEVELSISVGFKNWLIVKTHATPGFFDSVSVSGSLHSNS